MSDLQILHNEWEKVFKIEELLSNVRKDCNAICQENYETILPVSCGDSDDKAIFRRLKMKSKKRKDLERRNCYPEECKIIEKACKERQNSTNDVEHIKYSLGFIAKGYSSVYKNPCVAVVGQTKAGKSSLINCILQDRVLPEKVKRLPAARVTYVTYCPIKFVAHMQDERLIRINLDIILPDEDVSLKIHEINTEIRVGTTNTIAQSGFDIVDSPCLNKNLALFEKMERSLLPLLIYVVEGRIGLTQTDIDDIKMIKQRTPELKIMFFVSKLDRSKYDRLMYMEKKEKKGYKDTEDMPGESDVELAEKRLIKVLLKLKQNGFLPLSAQIEEFPDFHGADIGRVSQMRTLKPHSKITPAAEYNSRLINHFRMNLTHYLKFMFECSIKEEIQHILYSIENVLEKVNSMTSEHSSKKIENQTYLNLFQESEFKLFESEKRNIENTLKEETNDKIEDIRLKLIEMVHALDYTSSKKYKRSYDELEALKIDIKLSFNEEIKYFISNFFVRKEEQLRERLYQISENLPGGKCDHSSFKVMLRNQLLHNYKFFEEFSLSNSIKPVFNLKSQKRINEIISSQFQLFISASKSNDPNENDLDLDSNDWKISLINSIVNEFDRDNFFKVICAEITEEFTERHKRFEMEINEQRNFLSCDLVIDKEANKCVKTFTESLALQYAITLHAKTPLYLQIDPQKHIEKIAKGGQGQVEKIFIIGEKEAIVRKHYKQTFKDLNNSERLLRISMEIYYSSRLDHPCCLKLLGIHFEDFGEGWRFSAFFPYLEKGGLKRFLKLNSNNQRVSLKERLKLGVDIAKGIKFLHTLNIVHRDINLKNILIREDSENAGKVAAVLSDYGLTKSFGFIENTEKIGTPLYMAPEFFTIKSLIREGYTAAVDVFSFGMCMWQLMSYNLTDAYANYYPRFAIDCEHNKQMIEKLVLDGVRPEERNGIPTPVYDVIKRCWHGKPNKRPSFYKPLKEVDIDCKEDDPMKDKTILDMLEESIAVI